MKSLKYALSASFLIFFIALTFSCKKRTENIIPETDSNTIVFSETTPTLGTLPFVGVSRSNAILMAKKDSKIFVFLRTPGGGDFSVAGFTYDVNSNSFNTVKSLATGLFISTNGYNSTLVDVGTSLWYASTNISLNYNISTDSWTSNNPLANASCNGGVCAMNGKVYYAGSSYVANVGPTASVLFNVYDLAKGTWTEVSALPYLAENPALQPESNRYIYAIGGESVANSGITRKFSMYDSQTDTWTALPNLPFDYYASKNNHATTILKNKYLLAFSNNKVFLYNLSTKQWNAKPVLDLGTVVEINNINIFSNSTVNTDDGNAFYLAATNINGEFKIKKYTIN